MALIECPVCDRKISDKAKSCPGCGTSMEEIKRIIEERENAPKIIACPECGFEFKETEEVCPECGLPTSMMNQNISGIEKIADVNFCVICGEEYSSDEMLCLKCGYPRLTLVNNLDMAAEQVKMQRADFYLHRLMSDCGVTKKEDLALCDELFDAKDSYKMLMCYCDADVKAELKGYIEAKKEKLRIEELYSKARELMEQAKTEESYIAVAKAFEEISQYEDAGERAVICRDEADKCRKDRIYNKANDRMALGDESSYVEAVKLFGSISGYMDSNMKVLECQIKLEQLRADIEKLRVEELYSKAKESMEQAKTEKAYLAAAKAFEEISQYEDSHELAVICRGEAEKCRKDRIYNRAKDKMKGEDVSSYEEAIKLFREIEGWKDADAQRKACQKKIEEKRAENITHTNKKQPNNHKKLIAVAGTLICIVAVVFLLKTTIDSVSIVPIESAKIGDTIVFGEYEQDKNTSNGKEEIEWQVLDKQDNKLFVISKYGLDGKSYNEEYEHYVTWETCDLRKWLNEEFLYDAFSSKERNKILKSEVSAEEEEYCSEPGNDTYDKIFMLNVNEVEQYFKAKRNRKCIATPYAIHNGVSIEATLAYKDEAKDYCAWLLRTPLDKQDIIYYVKSDGHIGECTVDYNYFAIRPVLWISLES